MSVVLTPSSDPIVGRDKELSEISDVLLTTGCRLLTIVGPGGIGKTRLALELTQRLAGSFAHGAQVVSLQSVDDHHLIASTIADALAMPASGHETPEEQVLRRLRDKHILLLLDNYEHLLPEVDFIVQLLDKTANTCLMFTSREALNLRGECVYRLDGLPVPPDDEPTDRLGQYGAIQLFERHVQRVSRQSTFADKASVIARICRAVEGMPLGIELAASWAKTLTCEEIADEIERSLDFLTTPLRDFPTRHRSIRAVFDHSWAFLNEEERAVFQRLSVFRGGFLRDAAEQVAGATLSLLSSLVDKSLLQHSASGRYQFHELLRQYAEQKLMGAPEEYARVRAAHTTYFTELLGQQDAALLGEKQVAATELIMAEIENVRAAWAEAVERCDARAIIRATASLIYLYDYRGHHEEELRALTAAREAFEQAEQTQSNIEALARVLVALSLGCLRVARVDEAHTGFVKALALYERYNAEPQPGVGTDPRNGLGIVAMIDGKFDEAIRFGEKALQDAQKRGDALNQMTAHYVLSSAALAQGQYQRAYLTAQQAYTISRAAGSHWFMSYCLNHMGLAVSGLGDYAAAQSYFEESYEASRKVGHPEATARALVFLGRVVLSKGSLTKAGDHYRESAAIFREINDYGGLAEALSGLAETLFMSGSGAEARACYREALEIVSSTKLIALGLTVLVSVGKLFVTVGDTASGVPLLLFVIEHSHTEYSTRAQAERSLQALEAKIAPDVLTAARARVPWDWSAAVSMAQDGLRHLPPETHISSVSEAQAAHTIGGPLTEREVEILRMLADGLSNQEIADRLFLALGTVKRHNHNIFNKLGVNNRVQALAQARALGLF